MPLKSVPHRDVPVAGYEAVAGDYYDTARHPTCAALRAGSTSLLRELLPNDVASIAEIGVGKAITPALTENWTRPPAMTLIDSSPTMLSHSACFERADVQLVLAEAAATGLPNSSVDCLIASLGDPYNTPAFWNEARRILSDQGTLIFTTPSLEWASTFRKEGQDSPSDTAEFVTEDGDLVAVPSFVMDEDRQRDMIEDAGFDLAATATRSRRDVVETEAAPKLGCLGVGTPFVTAYLARPRS